MKEERGMNMCCSRYDDIVLSLESIKEKNKLQKTKTKNIQFQDIMPAHICIHAYAAAFPYCLTLLKKGWFLWVKKKDGVICQCPNPHGSVVMKIKPTSDDTICITVEDVRGICPCNHKTGDCFIFDPKTMKEGPELFSLVYPSATELHYSKEKYIALQTREKKVCIKKTK